MEDLSDIVTDDELVSASQLFELSESEFVMSTEQLAVRSFTDSLYQQVSVDILLITPCV